MNRYEKMLCPICKGKLFEEDTVVCPDCGAPAHRDCYKKLGHCFYADKHGTAEQWMPPKIETPIDIKFERCPNCGHQLTKGEEKCANCGKVVTEQTTQTTQTNTQFNQNERIESQQQAENPFFERNRLDKNEDIGGVKVSEIASFVGYNALRYIRIFKKFNTAKTKISWNWVSFLVPELWLISRKCYGPGILMGFFKVLMSVLLSVSYMNVMQSSTIDSNNMIAMTLLAFISMIVSVIFGMFGDYIYKGKVYKTLEILKANGTVDEFTMLRVGGVNLFLPMIMYMCIYFLANLIVTII